MDSINKSFFILQLPLDYTLETNEINEHLSHEFKVFKYVFVTCNTLFESLSMILLVQIENKSNCHTDIVVNKGDILGPIF